MNNASRRAILRSSSLIAVSQFVTIFAGLVRLKAAAVFLGPAGVGLAGLYTSLVQTAAAFFALGLGNAGAREVAVAHAAGGEDAVWPISRSLNSLTLVLALVGGAAFWGASSFVARTVVGGQARESDVAWLALGVILTVIFGSQNALLVGLRRIREVARINVMAGLVGSAVGVGAILSLGMRGLVVMVIAPSLVSYLNALATLHEGKRGPHSVVALGKLVREWCRLLKFGAPLMLSGITALAGQLAVRAILQRVVGVGMLGEFQAAWGIGAAYLTVVLSALSVEYFPRLSAALGNGGAAAAMVNDQTEIIILLCSPIILTMMGLAPWVVKLLYSSQFDAAVGILRWQLIGDVFKIVSWPLSFILLGGGFSGLYMFAEAAGVIVFVSGVIVGAPIFGVDAAGAAFLLMYIVYLPIVRWLGGRAIPFRWSKRVSFYFFALLVGSVAVDVISYKFEVPGAFMGVIGGAVAAIHAITRLSSIGGDRGLAHLMKWRRGA